MTDDSNQVLRDLWYEAVRADAVARMGQMVDPNAWKKEGSGFNGQMEDGPKYSEIRNAKRKSTILMMCGLGLGMALGSPVAAFAGWTLSSWYRKQVKMSEYIRKGMVEARPEDIDRFRRIVNEMADRAGMSETERPQRIVVAEDDLANAGAGTYGLPKLLRERINGRNRYRFVRSNDGYIAAFSGVLRAMGDEELRGIVAHELTHWKHADSRYGLAGKALTFAVGAGRGFIPFAAVWAIGGTFAIAPGVMWKAGVAAVNAMTTWKYGAWVGASVVAWIARSSMLRHVEYRADRGSAELVGHPEPLSSGLRRVEIHNGEVNSAMGMINRAMTKACGLSYKKAPNLAQRALLTVFSDHPSTYDRIRRLDAQKPNQSKGSGLSEVA